MRVVSYNIRKAVGLDWRRDPHRIVDVLSEIDADIVILQEADRRIGSRAGVLPLDRLKLQLGLKLVDVSLRPLSHGWHGNAIFLKSGLKSEPPSRIELPNFEPRGAVSVHIQSPNLEVVGVHLGLTPIMRRKQIQELGDLMRKADHPMLIAGDFNEGNQKRLSFDASAHVVSPGPSFHAARPTSTIDHFVLGPGLRDVSSFVHHSALSKWASDHLPVVVDIAVPHR